MSAFFIDRPVASTVVALIMLLLGAISLPQLPVEQYPEIAPPNVQISTSYPGADPATIVDTVTAPIEQEVNGVEGMIYMKSTTDQTGRVSINVTFELGTDPDQAVVYTQNRVSAAEPRLPQEVRSRGVSVKKRSPSLLMVATLISPDDSYDFLSLSNYTTLYVKDELARIEGVSEVFIFGGQDYAMRVWLDPEKLSARDLTTVDVLGALREQNVQVAAGRIGAPPAESAGAFEYIVNTEGRLKTVEQFEDIVLKTAEAEVDDQTVTRTLRLKDVARVELGAETYDWNARLNGQPGVGIGIYQMPGSNAIEVADAVKAKLNELSDEFPPGVEHQITFDFTNYVRSSVSEVVTTLFIAALLVVIITFIFLQDWRATIVPTVTIPVSLIATFAVMLVAGFSINLFTLFGLILAIGVVVDDAIVVVEDTSRRITEGMAPREAAKQTMKEVSGALIATTLVVLAVFIPAAMIGGLTGVLYQQFALTIVFATCFSTINALTLSPMLCALILKPAKPVRFPLFKLFNSTLDRTRGGYIWFVNKGIRLAVLTVLIFGGVSAAAVFGFKIIPTGFLPNEDQGYFFVNVQLPDGARGDRTLEVLERVEEMCAKQPGVRDVFSVQGYSLLSGTLASNNAMCIVILEDWDGREMRTENLKAVIGGVSQEFAGIQEASVFPFAPPAITGIGQAGGVEYELQDRSANGYLALQQAADAMVFAAFQDPNIERPFTGYRATTPQLFVDIDATKAQRLGVPPQIYNDTLQTNLGGSYVNDFNYLNRVFRVYLQAEGEYRDEVDDINNLQVRNKQGQTLPMGTFIEVQDSAGPQAINRYNLYPSASITAQPAPGQSTGQAIESMQQLSAENLPAGFGYEWTGATYQELETGSAAIIAFALGLIVVFLVLAFQYESWTTPIAILLTIPLGVLGALVGIFLRNYDINIYTQVGFILLIALVAKNAILIVEFAKQRSKEGKAPKEAALEAAALRFRPILMTAFSFIAGTAPLVIAVGAGAMSRRSLGTAVFFGMLVATVIGVVFVPVFYYLIQSLSDKLLGKPSPEPGDSPPQTSTV
ncbi:MAG: multidrug efflux RND transporter permease subunit [Planctomycetota bacterium]